MRFGPTNSTAPGRLGPAYQQDPFDGVIIVDKPSGPTSHDIVDAIRRKFGFKKVGHGGTLDPQATGLLIILIGTGTKLSSRFIGSDKVYEGTMRLGISTDSYDAQGKITREADCSSVTKERMEEVMGKFRGDLMQMPPMVSAVKVAGVPLYKSARKGVEVERQPRLIHIYDFRITSFSIPDVDFFVRCTKGTYVRSLCADIGDQLECGAHLTRLRRMRSGELKIEDAKTFEAIMAMDRKQLSAVLLPISRFSAFHQETTAANENPE